MKEIDLLPKWYKYRRRQLFFWRMQYLAIGFVLLAMMAWSFWNGHHTSAILSEIEQLQPKMINAQRVSNEFSKIKDEIKKLQTKENILDKIDSKIDVGSVLAEISFLIGDSIVISEVDFKAERFSNDQVIQKNAVTHLTTAQSNIVHKGTGGARFKVTISGIAADAADVAELICKFEDSPYFWQVYPVFSRSIEAKKSSIFGRENSSVSEFKINCYLGNYRHIVPAFAKEINNKIL